MTDEIKCTYKHNGVNVTLEVQDDWDNIGSIVGDFAELVIKVITDLNFNADTIIELLKQHFDYEKECEEEEE